MVAGPYTQNCACRVVVVKLSGPCVADRSCCIGHSNRNLLTQTGAIEGYKIDDRASCFLRLHLDLHLLTVRNPCSYLARVLK